MPKLLSRDVPAIEPRYWASAANTPIDLATERVRLEGHDLVAEGTGSARLEMSPRDRVVVSVALDGTPAAQEMTYRRDGAMRLWFGDSATPCKVLSIRTQQGSSGKVSMDLIVSSGGFLRCRNGRVKLANLLVHILNFPSFIGLSDGSEDFIHGDPVGTGKRLGRVVLKSGDWRVEIQECPETKQVVDALKAEGGNGITHVARVARTDGRMFSVRDAGRVTHLLQQFLSFARGLSTSVFGATGFDRWGAVVYEEWGNHPSTPWMGRMGWFDLHHGETLAELFPGFAAARNDASVSGTISTALYWYLRSNRGGEGAGTDGALILSQAALEGLATSCLARAGIAAKGNAAEKIRRGLEHLGIPTGVPKELRHLRTGKRKKVWKDGPHAITAIRNDLVHPTRRSPIPIGPAVPEAWRLAQWYLELAILRLADYSGDYSNRLASRWVGEIEKVPWA